MYETISIPVAEVDRLSKEYGVENLLIEDISLKKLLVKQAIDNDGDGSIDEILFQTTLKPYEEKEFCIFGKPDGADLQPAAEKTTFSRFVPERIDDYAWENDRVAFRTYGPKAQQITESGKPGGTLTSGIDAWLKRVNYPVIDNWYKKNLVENGYYHIDHGEGYDPYHVGVSRGVGGIGVWENDSLYVSKNFESYKIIATGPIRTIFELSYEPWQANDKTITETKRISLDLGSNLSRYEISVPESLSNLAIGLSLHDKSGQINANPEQGWYSYWEPIDDSEMGVGIVMDPKKKQSFLDHRVPQADQSHLMVLTDDQEGKLIYYAGFGWKKSKQFNSTEEWETYLGNYANRIATPVKVNFVK